MNLVGFSQQTRTHKHPCKHTMYIQNEKLCSCTCVGASYLLALLLPTRKGRHLLPMSCYSAPRTLALHESVTILPSFIKLCVQSALFSPTRLLLSICLLKRFFFSNRFLFLLFVVAIIFIAVIVGHIFGLQCASLSSLFTLHFCCCISLAWYRFTDQKCKLKIESLTG